MQRALAGDRAAQELLFRRHVRRAAGLAQRLLSSSAEEVDDLIQDAFISAFTQLDSLKEARAFGSWLGAIVVRTAHKRLRRQRLFERLGLARKQEIDLDDFALPNHQGEAAVELKRLFERLQQFPPDERVALLLRRVEGLEISEVAEQMALSESTVKRRLKRAEARLEGLGIGGAT